MQINRNGTEYRQKGNSRNEKGINIYNIVTAFKPKAKRIPCVIMNISVKKFEPVHSRPRGLSFLERKMSKIKYKTGQKKILQNHAFLTTLVQ